MNIQIYLIFTIVVVLLELVQLPEAVHKYVRPWKFYRPKQRWHPLPRTPKYRFKRGPPRKQHRHPKWHSGRYAPHHTAESDPYTIEIELPKHREEWSGYSYPKISNKRHRDYYEYHDEDYEDDSRVINAGKKRVRIKLVKGVKPKLRIKISRDDNLAELGVIDISRNVTTLYTTTTTSNPENFSYQTATLSPLYSNEWEQSFIRDLRGI